ncbi:MAG: cytochrome c [Pseudomonadota bacterium]|nr:cytochrome c [Pseudomonadota bacterium]
MRGSLTLAVAFGLAPLCSAMVAAGAAPVAYDLPPETAALAPGPNLGAVQANCSGCHSADYITTQPRSFADPRAFWTAEVAKMRKAYGATIAEADAKPIVDYLVVTYGR